jgi:hypothetical protein
LELSRASKNIYIIKIMRAREKNQQRERRRHREGERVRNWLLTSGIEFKKLWGSKHPFNGPYFWLKIGAKGKFT